MPVVEVRRVFESVSVSDAWSVLREFQRYPEFAEHVVDVTITKDEISRKESAWVVLFNGNQLRWTERDSIDDDRCTISFDQIDGDLAVWRGTLRVFEDNGATALYTIEFDLGVPALADLLNPLGVQAVRGNCEQILDAAARHLMAVAS